MRPAVPCRLPSLSIFMPAYDVKRHLESTVARIPGECLRAARSIWIVNDGSTDGTAGVIESVTERLAAGLPGGPKVHAITFPVNRGYGAAVRAALERVRDEPVEAAVCLHADGQYAPEEMPKLLCALRERKLDLVQGSRIASGTALSGNMPLYKYLAGRVLTAMENVVFRMRMTDYHSGYLCYGRRALDEIPFEELSDSFDFDLEAIASARARGLRVGEVPVPTCYEDQVSHLNSFTYGLRVLRVMRRYATGRYGCS